MSFNSCLQKYAKDKIPTIPIYKEKASHDPRSRKNTK